MVTLPKEFVAIKYPGYFWNLKEKRLYSMKVQGILRPLYFSKPNFFNKEQAGYKISVNGHSRYMLQERLMKLVPADSIIPVEQK